MFVMKRQSVICLALVVVAGCIDAGPDSVGITPNSAVEATGDGREWRWSEPVNLGPIVNSDASDTNPSMSPDELSLYFVSARTGGQGGLDLWVSQRASLHAPWGQPENLGPTINTASSDAAPTLSDDGHLLFFYSDRPGGQGDWDLWVSYREDVHDDFAWGEPVNLGTLVNTAAQEAGAEFVNANTLIFNRRQAPGATPPFDLYMVAIGEDGMPTAAPAPITELNTAASDFGAEVNDQEREMLFISNRPGTLGGNDLWRTTRLTKHAAWTEPENLGPVINTALNDRHPSLSNQGHTLIFASNRPGGSGSDDLWMSTRKPGAQGQREGQN